jgi:hypothetical protein
MILKGYERERCFLRHSSFLHVGSTVEESLEQAEAEQDNARLEVAENLQDYDISESERCSIFSSIMFYGTVLYCTELENKFYCCFMNKFSNDAIVH